MKKSNLVISIILSSISIFLIGLVIFFDKQKLSSFLDVFPFILLLIILFFTLYFNNIYKSMQKDLENEKGKLKAETLKEEKKLKEEYEEKIRREEEEKRKECPYVVKSELKLNLNNKTVWLIDYENCAYLPKEIKNEDACFVFMNNTQENKFKNELILKSTNAFISKIVSNTTGKNLADIKIGLYVGMICSLYTPQQIYIVSKDQGFETLIRSCAQIGINILKTYNPNRIELVSDPKCEYIYKDFLKTHREAEMSLGNFRKKLKNKHYSMTIDEINYVIEKLNEQQKISIIQGRDGKIVKLR